MKLLGTKSLKWEKSDKAGTEFLTAGMYLAPYKLSGKNFCPHASKGCAAACLFTSGRGRYPKVQTARIKKSHWFIEDRAGFLAQLEKDIAAFARKCDRKGKRPAIRLNGTSDLAWERIAPRFFRDFPGVQFYDYTKSYTRMLNFIGGHLPSNYHLTFSRSEVNEAKCLEVLKRGGNVSVVFKSAPLEWNGYPVYNADNTDLRFLDPFGVGALTAKGKARHDTSGFVVPNLRTNHPNSVLLGTA